MTGIVLGVSLIAAGVAIVRGRAMSRWAGSAAIGIGVLQVVSSPFGADATPLSALSYVWSLDVGGCFTFRPNHARDVDPGRAHASVARGLPVSS